MDIMGRLNKVFEASEEINIDDNSKIIIMSDVHRGDGNWSDSFARNQNIFLAALSHYFKENYTYIELGDGDELWELKDFKEIAREHSDVFWLMSEFYKDNRFYMLYGNHDIVKRDEKFLRDNLYYIYNERQDKYIPLFKDIKVHEGLVLKYKDKKMFLVHGHQVDFLNYDIWPIARFLVRYFWRPLELYGIKDVTRTAKNYKKRSKVGRRLTEWVKEQAHILIAGHNHRAYFPEVGDAPYFNDGSTVHPRCILGIEIINGYITLVKWSVKTDKDKHLYVGKDILAGPRKLEDYYKY